MNSTRELMSFSHHAKLQNVGLSTLAAGASTTLRCGGNGDGAWQNAWNSEIE